MARLVDDSGKIAYFGKFSWGNTVDWLVTIWAGVVICVGTTALGSVRPDTHLVLLPLLGVLLALHGLWLAVDEDKSKRLSQVPLWFLPFLIWVFVNTQFLSPTPWRGWTEVVYALEAFILFWVLVNNVRTRAHIGLLFIIGLFPVAVSLLSGLYQVFQKPEKIADALGLYRVALSPEMHGIATGTFADSGSFSVLLLLIIPILIFAAIVPRLSVILRVFSGYLALMGLGGLVFAQLFWPIIPLSMSLFLIPILAFRKWRPRIVFWLSGAGVFAIFFLVLYFLSPVFKPALEKATSVESEGVRKVLWVEALEAFSHQPVVGIGAGSFSKSFEESSSNELSRIPETPHNDYLLLMVQYGIVGAVLFLLPMFYVYIRGFRAWRAEPYRVRLKLIKGEIVSPNKFLLSIGFAGATVFLICGGLTFLVYSFGLVAYGVCFFSILSKVTFPRAITIPSIGLARIGYLVVAVFAGVFLSLSFWSKFEAKALELHASQMLEKIIGDRAHLGSDPRKLDGVMGLFEEAVTLDPKNADAWIGLSAANAQLFYRNPGNFREVGAASEEHAEEALRLAPEYWKAWAQLGIANALSGDVNNARESLGRAVELAPNNSNALYFKAAFLSEFPESRAEATTVVERALEINPNNRAARRLQQKLLIL